MTDNFQDFNPIPGIAEDILSGLRRLLAPNPSPMTFRGTNTYLLGHHQIAVIDPGPDIATHLDAILRATDDGKRISHILLTHAHLDHSPLSRQLSQVSGAPILAFGKATDGRSEIMQKLAATGLAGGGEGIDLDFIPGQRLHHGEHIITPEWQIEALHTPGHIGNHMCFAWGDICFTGDHVMGWASSLVSPPDGDLTDFMASCRLLGQRQWSLFLPSHGAPIKTPNARLDWLITHRLGREVEILKALQNETLQAHEIAKRLYKQTPPALMGAATRNVFAHLVDLTQRGIVKSMQPIETEAFFQKL